MKASRTMSDCKTPPRARISARVAPWLVDWAQEKALENGDTLSQWVEKVLKEAYLDSKVLC